MTDSSVVYCHYLMVMETLRSLFRMVLAFVFVGIVLGFGMLLLLGLLPWRRQRILMSNAIGRLLGWGVLRIMGARIEVEGREHIHPSQPAIYVGNHTSILDAFTSIWLVPPGTVGVAKKEIIYYPFYGLAWLLAGHPTIDRTNSSRAQASLNGAAAFIRDNKLSICLWPEGTRSRSGRLLRFKKGVIHLAIKTGLPIVPIVISDAQRVWPSWRQLRGGAFKVKFLPPLDTSNYSLDTIDLHLDSLRQTFVQALPVHHRPIED